LQIRVKRVYTNDMRKISLLIIAVGILLATSHYTYAARSRVRPGTGVNVVSSGVSSSVRFRSDRRAVIISLANLNKAISVTYSLTYTGSGIAQGAQGTVSPAGENSATRELLFGTCSKNVCTYHTNIINARLEIRSKLKSGVTTVKPYRLKV